MNVRLTPELVDGLWIYLSDEYGSELIGCDNKITRQAISWILDAIGVSGKRAFLDGCSLTIGESVYLPFDIGASSTRWPLLMQAAMIVHEHHHVWQSIEYGDLVFAAGYICDKQMRAHLEAEALQAAMEFQCWLTGVAPDHRTYARSVLRYGLTREEVRYVATFLQGALPGIRDGKQWPVVQDAIKWLTGQKD